MCAPSPPPAPNYTEAAAAQGAANIEAARTTAKLSNPNVISPYGTQTVTYGGGVNQGALAGGTGGDTFAADTAAYNQALAKWNAAGSSQRPVIGQEYSTNEFVPTNIYGPAVDTRGPMPVAPMARAARAAPLAPGGAGTGGAGTGGAGTGGAGTGGASPEQEWAWANSDPDQALVRQTFSPEQQGLYNRSVAIKGLLGDLGVAGASQLKDVIGRNFDLSTVGPQPGSPEETRQQVAGNLATLGPRPASPEGTRQQVAGNLAALGPRPASSEETRRRVFNAMTARTDREFAENKEAINSQLIAQGIGKATPAYGTEMRRLSERDVDARQRADLASFEAARGEVTQDLALRQQGLGELMSTYDAARGVTGQEAALRQQGIAELLSQRQTPLNEVTALMSGSQVSNPFAGGLGYQAGATAQPAPVFSAAQQQGLYDQNAYNQEVGSYNNLVSGIFGIGAAGAGGWARSGFATGT